MNVDSIRKNLSSTEFTRALIALVTTKVLAVEEAREILAEGELSNNSELIDNLFNTGYIASLVASVEVKIVSLWEARKLIGITDNYDEAIEKGE